MRIGIHILAAIAAAIAGGTVRFAGLSPKWVENIVTVASLVGIATNIYMAGTSTGINKGELE